MASAAVVALLASCLLALPAVASGTAANRWETLGPEATLYRIFLVDEAGRDLSPGSKSGVSLELEISRPGQEIERIQVPGTEDASVERTPSLSFSQASNTLLIVWEHQTKLLHSQIRVVGYKTNEGFTDLADLGGTLYYSKRKPQALLTTDSAHWREIVDVSEGSENGPSSIERQVTQRLLHVVWREEQGHVFYAALAEGDAGETAFTRGVDLSEALSQLSDSWGVGIDGALKLSPGRDGQTVLISFIDPVHRTLESVQVSKLPIELSLLADEGFETVLRSADAGTSDLIAVAEEARSHIVFIGRRMLSESTTDVLSTAAARAVSQSTDFDQDGWLSVAENARSHIVFIGRSLRLDRPDTGEDTVHVPLELALRNDDDLQSESTPETQPTVNLFIDHLSSVPLPADAPDNAEIIVSEDNERFLLFWHASDQAGIYYTEGNAEGWGQNYLIRNEQTGSVSNTERLLRNRFRTSR